MPDGKHSERRGESIRAGRDIAPFGLRIPDDLRQQLQKEAGIAGRSLNAEILSRLRQSLFPRAAPRSLKASEPSTSPYMAASDTERAILNVFRRLPPEKQLALLSLFQ